MNNNNNDCIRLYLASTLPPLQCNGKYWHGMHVVGVHMTSSMPKNLEILFTHPPDKTVVILFFSILCGEALHCIHSTVGNIISVLLQPKPQACMHACMQVRFNTRARGESSDANKNSNILVHTATLHYTTLNYTTL
jgi:hypothetical protein